MSKRVADHQLTNLNQHDTNNDTRMEGNFQRANADQMSGRQIARPRQRRGVGGGASRGMMGGGAGSSTPASPFTGFNFGAASSNAMTPTNSNAGNIFGSGMSTMNNAPNAPVFGQSSNTSTNINNTGGMGGPGFAPAAPSSAFSFSFGGPSGSTANTSASNIFGTGTAPTPAAIFGQPSTLAPTQATGGFGSAMSSDTNSMDTGFGGFGQAAANATQSAVTASSNPLGGGFNFGMTASNNGNNTATESTFGQPMSAEKTSQPAFGGFHLPPPPPIQVQVDLTLDLLVTIISNTTTGIAPSGGFTFGMSKPPTAGGFTFGSTTTTTTTASTDKPANPFALPTTSTPGPAADKPATSGGFSFGLSANTANTAINPLEQTGAETKKFSGFVFGSTPSKSLESEPNSQKKALTGRGFSFDPSATNAANTVNSSTTSTTTSSSLFSFAPAADKDTSSVPKPFTFGSSNPVATTDKPKETISFGSAATTVAPTTPAAAAAATPTPTSTDSNTGFSFKPSTLFGTPSTTTSTTTSTTSTVATNDKPFGVSVPAFKPPTITNVDTSKQPLIKTDNKQEDKEKTEEVKKTSMGFGTVSAPLTFNIPTTKLSTDTTTTDTDNIDEKDLERYYMELRGLNLSFLEHIQSSMNKDPFMDLTDAWTIYQKHRRLIDSSHNTSTS
ncbi:hypothetical protein BDF19DRAFT_450686 [Syncephalis fuscata]|nr:hypothetical protein BDF19DRAFT_450686 [Syncephalis fuscata]